MNTLNTLCWRGAKLISLKPKQSKLGYLGLLFWMLCIISFAINTTSLAQIAGNISQSSTVSADTTTRIDIRPNNENEYFVADYLQGDGLQFDIAVSKDSYVYVFSIDSDLRYAQVLPNSFEANNYVYAVQGASYPSYQGNYGFSLEALNGFTTLFAIASPRAISEARLERYVRKYLLFAEAYSDPAKLSNVVIGPDIGADISYLRVSGNQGVQSAGNTVPVNPAYYQLDYALDSVIAPDIVSNTVLSTDVAQNAEGSSVSASVLTNGYDLSNYSDEYSTGAYATPEYQEVLRAYQASMDIYNTYANETANEIANASETVNATTVATDNTYKQTITLNGPEVAQATQPVVVESSVNVVNPVNEATYQQQIPVSQVNTVASEVATVSAATDSIVLTSPIAASTARPLSVIEQSLQSAVNTSSPFKSWTALDLKDYSFVFQQFCYCSDDYLYEMLVTVANGQVSRVQYLENDQDVPEYVFDSIPSIEDIYMGIAEIRVEGLTTVNVAYNQDYSFPNSAYFVNNPETEVDDLSYQISNFEVQ